jgi:phosphoglycolate phosphatase-like HAD superfamily hydrolase
VNSGFSDRYDLIVFDFDGTLCDSVNVKTEAFRLLYLEEHGADFADRVLAYHLENAGVPRFDKIRHIEREMLGSEPSEERVDEVADSFGRIVEEQVIAAPLFEGVVEFLRQAPMPLVIASAAPTVELRRIINAKGIDQYFEVVEGSPQSKGEIVTGYIDQFNLSPDHVLMVGDQPSDLRAAHAGNTDFIAIIPPGEPEDWARPFPVVPDFAAFADIATTGLP